MSTGVQCASLLLHDETDTMSLRLEAAKEASADAVRLAYQALRSDFITTAFSNPLQPVRTPGFRDQQRMPLVDVIEDMLSSDDGLHFMERMVMLMTACAEGDDPTTRLPGHALLMALAHRYANFHAQDAAEQDGANA